VKEGGGRRNWKGDVLPYELGIHPIAKKYYRRERFKTLVIRGQELKRAQAPKKKELIRGTTFFPH